MKSIALAICLIINIIPLPDTYRDSLKQVIRHGLYTSPERCLKLTDSLETEGMFSKGEAALEKAIIYNYLDEKRLALMYANLAYEDQTAMDEEKFRLSVLDNLITLNMALSEYENAIKYSISYLKLLENCKDASTIAQAFYDYAIILYRTGDTEEGVRYFDKAFQTLEDEENPRCLADLSFLYGQYVSVMTDEKRLDDAVSYSLKRMELLKRMEKMKGIPAGYMDQQYGYLYSKLAYVYILQGHKKEAAICYQSYERTDYSKTAMGLSYGISYLMAAGLYDKVIDDCKTIIKGTDTLSTDWILTASFLADAYRLSRNFEEASSLYDKIEDVNSELYKMQNSSLVKEMATAYKVKERDQEIQLQQRTIQYQKMMLAILLVIVVALLLMVWYISSTQKALKAKNAKLYENIQNASVKKGPAPISSQDPELDAALSKIISDKLFLKEDFDRKEMVRLMGTNENHLYTYIKEISDLPIASYINSLRLDYSLTLLTASAEKHDSIEGVAFSSGFANVRTYQRLFKTQYGITPSEYQKLSREGHAV